MGRAVGGRAAALLLAGRTVSRFGSSFYLVALPLYVLERTGSLGASGPFFTLTSLPPLLAVPFLGPLVERAHRKGLLILCDFGASALCALLLLFPGPPLPLYYRVVVIRAPLQGLCYTVRDAVDWCRSPTTRWFKKGSNHSPLQFC